MLQDKLDIANLIKDQEIKKIKEKYKILIEEKINTIEELKSKLNGNIGGSKSYNNLLDGEKLIAINFISDDLRINYSIICKNKTKFYLIEGQLYEKYPAYASGKSFFMFNKKRVDRWKTLEENGINGYTIILKKIED